MRRAGLGALFEAFSRLKAKLEKEGLFAPERKMPLPIFPRRIGLITSPVAAALRDVLTTLRRRMPAIPVILYPTPVQGEGAGQKIAAAIDAASARRECDVLILCRGGGSIEDLWAFNEEIVARAVFACEVPVVCGVGHETDFTIADFAADARAPTPTGAAELVSPNRIELATRLAALQARSVRAVLRGVERRMQVVDYLGRRLSHPGERIGHQQQHLAHLSARLGRAASHVFVQTASRLDGYRHRLAAAALDVRRLEAQAQRLTNLLESAMQRALEGHASTLGRLEAHLHALSPQLVLERGYSIVARADGHIVREGAELRPGEDVTLTFARGGALARVTRTRE
jgi:exodeoxyribonuclease VII large subunit